MKTNVSILARWASVLILALAFLAGTGVPAANAATVTCADPCDSAALTAAIAAAVDGVDTVSVPAGTFTLDALVTVNKDVTIQGTGPGETIFQVSGAGHRIALMAAGSSLLDVEIVKTDNTTGQNIIYIAASNVTLSNLDVHGQWVMGNGEVNRAIEATGGNTGIVIEDSTFTGLRQPGYLNTSEFTIRNNYVAGTRGWVLEGANVTFTGNTWGSGASGNAVDIAILSSTNPAYYPDILAISAANNGAVIEDQRAGVMTHVWVDDSGSPTGNGYQISPFAAIQPGIDKVVPGGTVYVGAGEYLPGAADLTITKSLSLVGAGKTATLVKLQSARTNGVTINGTDLKITIQGMTFTRTDGSDYGPGFMLRIGEVMSSFTGFTLLDVDVSYGQGRNVIFGGASGSTYEDIVIQNSDFHHAGSWGLSVDGATDGLTIANSTFTDNGSVDAGHGIGLDIGNGGIANVSVTGSDFSRNTMKGLNLVKTTNAVFDNITVSDTGDAPNNSAFTIYEWLTSTSSNITIRNSRFENNNRMAILLGTDAGNTISDVTITGNIFTGNGLGAVFNWSAGTISGINVHHNSIINVGNGVFDNQTPSAIVAENNWWGCNEGPGQAGCTAVSANVDADPWLVLTPQAGGDPIRVGAGTSFTANLTINSDDVDTTAQGFFPDGVEVGFTATGGTVDPASDLTEDGLAQTAATAGQAPGTMSLCALLDNETACTDLAVFILHFLPVVNH